MKSKIQKVLFITEKWCDGDPRKGITNSYHNLFGTFAFSFPDVQLSVVHLDEIMVMHRQHIDTVIPHILESYTPDLVIVSHLGSSPMNPTVKSYELIKQKNIPICFTWPDTRDWVIDAINELDKIADLHVSFGGEEENPINQKHINLWAPQDPSLYYPDNKFIPVSFTGSLQGNYTYRREYIKYLIDNKAPIIVAGGQREQGLVAEEYARIVRSSHMCINFPESAKPGFDQIKGRVFEILASQSLLLEKKNKITSRYLTPGIHYVEYTDHLDLLDKINYYSSNINECLNIAKQGKQIYEDSYNPKIFWNKIMKKMEFVND
jgi:hypothetical protein